MKIEDVICILIIMVGFIRLTESLKAYSLIHEIIYPTGIVMMGVIIYQLSIRGEYLIIHMIALVFLLDAIRYTIRRVNVFCDNLFKPRKIK